MGNIMSSMENALALRKSKSVTIWEVIFWGFGVCFVTIGFVILFTCVFLKCRNYRNRRTWKRKLKRVVKERQLQETQVEAGSTNNPSALLTSSAEEVDKHPTSALDAPKMDNLNAVELTELPKVDNVASGNNNIKKTEVLFLKWKNNNASKNISSGNKGKVDSPSPIRRDQLKNPLLGSQEMYKEMQERMALFENRKSNKDNFIV